MLVTFIAILLHWCQLNGLQKKDNSYQTSCTRNYCSKLEAIGQTDLKTFPPESIITPMATWRKRSVPARDKQRHKCQWNCQDFWVLSSWAMHNSKFEISSNVKNTKDCKQQVSEAKKRVTPCGWSDKEGQTWWLLLRNEREDIIAGN